MTRKKASAELAVFLGGALAVAVALLLGGASLHAQNPDQVKQLLKTGKCRGCDLQNVQLVNVKLTGADLTGANLSGAFLYRTILHGAMMKGALLTGANLGGTDLSGALDVDLTNAITNEHTTCPNGKPGPCGR